MSTFHAHDIAEAARAEASKLTAVAAGAWHRFDRAQETAQELHMQIAGVALGLTPAVLAALELARGTAETEAEAALHDAEAAERAAMLAHVSVDRAEAFAEAVQAATEAAEAARYPAEVEATEAAELVTMPEADYWALVANACGFESIAAATEAAEAVAATLATEAEVFAPVSVTRSESHRLGPVTVTLGDELNRVTGLLGHLLARPVATRRPVTAVVDGFTVTVPGWAADLFRALMAGRWL